MSDKISKIQLNVIEKSLDKLFSKLGIDVEFSGHFFDRINDPRNVKQITIGELVNIYHSLYDKFGVKLSKTAKEIEELVKSISTDINIPINLHLNKKTDKLEMVAKTIMRKKNFQSSSPVLAVESFKTYLDKQEALDEALITFGGKAYPKFGQVVIQAGGAGSGKGFIQSKLLGIEGKVINVDDVKKWVGKSVQLVGLIKQKTGIDISYAALPLSDPKNTSILHDIISNQMGITDKVEMNLFKSIATSAPDRKPNLIFDVTLKDLDKLDRITRNVMPLGYEKDNIHIVWIVTPIEKARQQNIARGASKPEGRMVSDEILLSTHKGAAITLHDLIYSVDVSLAKYMNGDMWIAFNNAGADSTVKKSSAGGSFIAKGAQYVKVKKQGSPIQIPEKELAQKIASYVPKVTGWGDEK
jgi:hypothetical protein